MTEMIEKGTTECIGTIAYLHLHICIMTLILHILRAGILIDTDAVITRKCKNDITNVNFYDHSR